MPSAAAAGPRLAVAAMVGSTTRRATPSETAAASSQRLLLEVPATATLLLLTASVPARHREGDVGHLSPFGPNETTPSVPGAAWSPGNAGKSRLPRQGIMLSWQ